MYDIVIKLSFPVKYIKNSIFFYQPRVSICPVFIKQINKQTYRKKKIITSFDHRSSVQKAVQLKEVIEKHCSLVVNTYLEIIMYKMYSYDEYTHI